QKERKRGGDVPGRRLFAASRAGFPATSETHIEWAASGAVGFSRKRNRRGPGRAWRWLGGGPRYFARGADRESDREACGSWHRLRSFSGTRGGGAFGWLL